MDDQRPLSPDDGVPSAAAEIPARQPILNVPPITGAVTLVIIAVWGLVQLLSRPQLEWLLLNFSLVPARLALAASAPFRLDSLGALATLLTHALLHVQFLHLAVNAGFLLAFGSVAERALGARRYALLLAASAIGGAALQLVWDWGQLIVMYGASGAVSGCMGAVARIMLAGGGPRRRLGLNLIVILVALNLLIAVVGGGWLGFDGLIAWQAHIGGLLVGLALGRAPERLFRWR